VFRRFQWAILATRLDARRLSWQGVEEPVMVSFTVIAEEQRPGEVILTVADLQLLIRGSSVEDAVARLRAALHYRMPELSERAHLTFVPRASDAAATVAPAA
jgi:hypothetical protein